MPDLSDFLHGFGLQQGAQLAGYVLTNVQGEHRQIIRYREYEYPIHLVWMPQTNQQNPQGLLFQFNQATAGSKIIYSRYGNPYQCDLGMPQITQILPNGAVFIETVGHSYRV
jgi:hypothetical protein